MHKSYATIAATSQHKAPCTRVENLSDIPISVFMGEGDIQMESWTMPIVILQQEMLGGGPMMKIQCPKMETPCQLLPTHISILTSSTTLLSPSYHIWQLMT